MKVLWKLGERGVVAGAFLALPLALFVLGVMVVVTALQTGLWADMHALEEAGLVLTGRSLTLPGGAALPYLGVAQVREGSAAAALGIARGDVLVEVGGVPVERPLAAWSALARLPGPRREVPLRWIPRAEALLGALQTRAEAGRTLVVLAAPAPQAQDLGLRAGDVLLALEDVPIAGARQLWEAAVRLAREGRLPARLRVRRGEETLELLWDPRRSGVLPVERNAWRAWRALLTRLGDPRYPEQAGLLPAFLGSLGVVLVMAAVAFPLGIAAAIYLEEYARRTRFTAALEVLVASLAGLPSAVVGLLGLEIFARAMNLGRSILAGGFTLAVLVLPLVIIASREALRTVPRTLREAAFSVGATPWQTVRHHVLPYALPGILTGVVLSLSRALGEAAPLLFLGAFLYVTYVPQSLRDSFTVVPIQIFDWATRPQDGYAVVAACAILVLLGLVLLLNALAILLRARFQRRWAE